MRNQLKIVYSALTIVAMLGLTSNVHGVPAFARQTGLDCNSCHAPIGFPVLNAFGQAFRAGGMTQASEDTLMGDGEALSLPRTLNAAVIFKVRAHFGTKTQKGQFTPNGTATGKTISAVTGGTRDDAKTTTLGFNKIDLPDEWALWFGGRVSKHMGFDVEVGDPAALGALSFKAPIVYDVGPVKLGFVPYWTDAQGPGFGFETLSTGAVGNIKMFEGGEAQSARMYLDTEGLTNQGSKNGKAAGLGIYAWHPMGFVYYSAFANGGAGSITNSALAHYFRAAITPSLGGIDMAVGFQYITGLSGGRGASATSATTGALADTSTQAAIDAGNIKRLNFLGVDAQLMGTFGVPMMLAFNLGIADGTLDAYGDPIQNTLVYKGTVITVLYNVTLIEDLLNLGAGIRIANMAPYKSENAQNEAGKTTVSTNKATDGLSGNKVFALASATYNDKDGKGVAITNLADHQLIAEIKLNLARNMRLSLTGYKALGTPDVADTNGITVPTQYSATKEDKLTVMLFGGF
jgi:hypothetical protein